MDKREKIRAELEAKMNRINTSLSQMSMKEKKRQETRPDLSLPALSEKKQRLITLMAELERIADEKEYERAKSNIVRMMSDIDEEIRTSWAYLMF